VYARALRPHVCASGYAYKSGPPAREMYSEAEVASTYRRTLRPFPTPSLPRGPSVVATARHFLSAFLRYLALTRSAILSLRRVPLSLPVPSSDGAQKCYVSWLEPGRKIRGGNRSRTSNAESPDERARAHLCFYDMCVCVCVCVCVCS
jgi:hypothetical protein